MSWQCPGAATPASSTAGDPEGAAYMSDPPAPLELHALSGAGTSTEGRSGI